MGRFTISYLEFSDGPLYNHGVSCLCLRDRSASDWFCCCFCSRLRARWRLRRISLSLSLFLLLAQHGFGSGNIVFLARASALAGAFGESLSLSLSLSLTSPAWCWLTRHCLWIDMGCLRLLGVLVQPKLGGRGPPRVGGFTVHFLKSAAGPKCHAQVPPFVHFSH